jgi:nucleotide-binding universal stress UspA family protein
MLNEAPGREHQHIGGTVQESKAIVVGYDGSVEAAQAVRWAAEQAALRGCPLHLVHCTLWPLLADDADSDRQPSARIILEEGLAQAKEAAPSLEIQSTLLYGWPVVHLPQISAGEAMLVVGSRGIGGFMGLLVGSVSLEMAATAACPVAVIRPGKHPDGPVVVAIDSSGSPAALEDACTVATVTGADLRIVHVQHAPAGYRLLRDPVDAHQAAEAILNSAVKTAHDLASGTAVESQLLTDTSVPRAILSASRGARLTVVGTKGHGLIRGTIGSTAHAVLHHATGPVLMSRRNAATQEAQEAQEKL